MIAALIVWLAPECALAQLQRPSLTGVPRAGNFFVRTKRTREQKKRLQPNAADSAEYAAFLARPRTGIFRLMPDIGCAENVNIIRADAACLDYIPESSAYSFREKEHTIEPLSDLRLRNGYLISDGILAQGILVALGEIELDEIAATGAGLDFLLNYAPPAQGAEAQKQYLQTLRGVKIGGYEYKKALPIVENMTYALRVVAYKGSVYRSFRGYRFDVLFGDKRIDLTVAFRVVRREPDGSATLLWKEIERREAPRLVFTRRKEK
ncbi:MAG TPA: hypothetical protein VIL74_02680 [Pyrinomonadaceae bacterium]